MPRFLLSFATGIFALAGLGLATAPVQAQEQSGLSQWELHHQRFNDWRPQAHNKDYGSYGHRWYMGPDGYYYGYPNPRSYVAPPFWSYYSYPVYPAYGYPGYVYPQ